MFELSDLLLFATPVALSSVSLAALHWFPWNRGTAPLSRLDAYALGTAVIVGVPVLAMLIAHQLGTAHDALFWAALLIVNTLCAGATVRLAYWIDGSRAVSLEEVRDARRER